jgi:hypothetical protein
MFVRVGFICSGEDRKSRFWECLRHVYSILLSRLPLLFVIGALLFGKGARIGTATFLHCIERDDYTDKRYVD